MISKKDLKTYGINSIVDYFDIVIGSRINGQFKQSVAQFLELSKKQRITFLNHVQEFDIKYLSFYLNNLEV